MASRTLVAKPDAVLELVASGVAADTPGTVVIVYRTVHGKVFENWRRQDGTEQWFQVTE